MSSGICICQNHWILYNGQHRPGWDLAHAQDVNPHILHLLEGTSLDAVSLDAVHMSCLWMLPFVRPHLPLSRIPVLQVDCGLWLRHFLSFLSTRRRLRGYGNGHRPPHFCPEHNSKTISGILLKLHKMIKDVERKCSIQETKFNLAYFSSYFPFIKFSCPWHNSKSTEGN